MYVIGRPINGISINGLEFALDANGDELKFKTEESAVEFIEANGGCRADIDNCAFLIVDMG
jgi:hypothetical protein